MRKPHNKPTSWLAYKIVGPKQKELGVVYGDTEELAIEEAVKEFKVKESERNRVVVKRWD